MWSDDNVVLQGPYSYILNIIILDMRNSADWSLIQTMACRPFVAIPQSEPMMTCCKFDPIVCLVTFWVLYLTCKTGHVLMYLLRIQMSFIIPSLLRIFDPCFTTVISNCGIIKFTPHFYNNVSVIRKWAIWPYHNYVLIWFMFLKESILVIKFDNSRNQPYKSPVPCNIWSTTPLV